MSAGAPPPEPHHRVDRLNDALMNDAPRTPSGVVLGDDEGLSLLFAANPLPMWLYDVETLAFLEVNDAAVARYGYSREEFLRMRITDLRPEEEVERVRASAWGPRPILQHTGGWRHRLRDGRLVDVEVTSHTLAVRGRTAVLVVVHDVTDRKRAELALRQSEARKAAILESALDCIITMDGEGRIVDFNPAAERTFGYARTAAVGRPLAELIIPSDLRAAHYEGLRRFRATGEHRVLDRRIEMRAIRADGTEFPVELAITAIRGGDAPMFSGHLRDISDRKRTEDALRRLNAELDERVRQRTAQLQAAIDELEAFAYSVSHDLRAPLRAIDGFSLALLEDHGPSLDGDARATLDRVRAATRRMAQLIDDLLELSRVARAEMIPRQVDVSAMAGEVLAELAKFDPDRRVAVRIEAGLAVSGDERLLRIVIENLLSNAWKFTSREAEATIEVGRLDQSSAESGAEVFFVRDNGVGFDPAYAGKLFGAFQRLHLARDFPGSGIGLATVRRIIHRHGGRVWADSTVGGGATFYFTLGAEGRGSA